MIGPIGYSKDLCNEKLIEKESIERYGCVTPFVRDKSNICQDRSKANKSLNVYKDAIYWDHFKRGCFNPCSIFSITTTKSGLIQTEGDSLLCGGITLMTHFMEQKLRQIFKKFLLFCRLSTKL